VYYVNMRRCGLNTDSINNIINNIHNTNTLTSGSRQIILGPNSGSSFGDPNESRSSASDTAYAALIAAGWTITLP